MIHYLVISYKIFYHCLLFLSNHRAEAIYQSMKSTYGSHACHLLRINSRSVHTAENAAPNSSDAANHMPDPWSQYLNKTIDTGVSMMIKSNV